MASDTAKSLLRDLTTTGQAYEAGDPDSRLKLVELCKELTAELESPGETFMRTNWAEVSIFLPATVAIDRQAHVLLSQHATWPSASP
jgi:hypothetical protein